MTYKSLILSLFALTVLFPVTVSAQAPVFELETVLDTESQKPWALYPGRPDGIYFEYKDVETPATDPTESKAQQLVRTDSNTGVETIFKGTLSVGVHRSQRHRVVKILSDYTITRSGPYKRYTIFRNTDGEVLGSGRMADEVVGTHIEDDIVYFLQYKFKSTPTNRSKKTTVLSRFKLSDMSFLDETEISLSPTCNTYQPRNIINGKIPIVKMWDSSEGRKGKLFMFSMEEARKLKSKWRTDYCGTWITNVGQTHFAIKSGIGDYGIYQTENADFEFIIYGLEDANSSNIVFSDDYVFVQPIYNSYHKNKLDMRPIAIYDLKNGEQIASMEMPSGQMRVSQKKLLISKRKRQGMTVSVYNINVDSMRDSSKN